MRRFTPAVRQEITNLLLEILNERQEREVERVEQIRDEAALALLGDYQGDDELAQADDPTETGALLEADDGDL